MSALTLFTDGIYYICPLKDIFIRGRQCAVKYSNKKKYSARVLVICNDEKLLTKLKLNADGANNNEDNTLIYVGSSELSYLQATKAITKDKGQSTVYVEKILLPAIKKNTNVGALSWDAVDFEETVLENLPCFLHLKVENNVADYPPSVINQEIENKNNVLSVSLPHCDQLLSDGRSRWTEEQSSLVLTVFNKSLEAGKIPSGAEMQALIYCNACLKGRTVPQLRSWLHNQRKKMKKENSSKFHKKRKGEVKELGVYEVEDSDGTCIHEPSDIKVPENCSGISQSPSAVLKTTILKSTSPLTVSRSANMNLMIHAVPLSHSLLRNKNSNSDISSQSLYSDRENGNVQSFNIITFPGPNQYDLNGNDHLHNNNNVLTEECLSGSPEVQQFIHTVTEDDRQKDKSKISLVQADNYEEEPVTTANNKKNFEVKNHDGEDIVSSVQPDGGAQCLVHAEGENPELSWAAHTIQNLHRLASSAEYQHGEGKNSLVFQDKDREESLMSKIYVHNHSHGDERQNGKTMSSKFLQQDDKSKHSKLTKEINSVSACSHRKAENYNDVESHAQYVDDQNDEAISEGKNNESSSDPTDYDNSGSQQEEGQTDQAVRPDIIFSDCEKAILPIAKLDEKEEVFALPDSIHEEFEVNDKTENRCNLIERSTLNSGTMRFPTTFTLQEPIPVIDETMIITPSATPNSSKVALSTREFKLLPNINFEYTETPLNESIFEALLNKFSNTACGEEINENDPFHLKVYPERVPPCVFKDKKANEDLMTHPVGQGLSNETGPKIVAVQTDNIPSYIIVSDQKTRVDVKRQLSLINIQSEEGSEPIVTCDHPEDPLFYSTMCESENSVEIKGNQKSEPCRSESDSSDTDEDNKRNGNYIPEDETSSDSDEEVDLGLEDVKILGEKEQHVYHAIEPLNITLGEKAPVSAPDDRELKVDNATSKTKKHFCLYCQKLQSKLGRHLELVHSNEEDVKKFKALPPGCKERLEIIATLRKNGDYLFNTDRRFNDGALIVCRRPNARMKKTAEDFLTCGNCKGQYSRTVLRHHFRNCTKRSVKRERIVLVKGKKIAARVHPKASDAVRRLIYPYMREDEVVRGVRYDELLTVYANKQCEKYGTHQHLYQMIRARLRLLGRFFIEMKSRNETIKEFSQVFNPRYYDCVIMAVRQVAGYVPEEHIFKTPAVASNLGTLMKHVGEILRSECIKNECPDDQRRVEDFLKLLAEDFGISINRVVAETQTQNNRRKEIILPSTEDIKKLYDFVKAERSQYYMELTKEFSYEMWNNLGKTTLLSLQIFNRRRPGEIERIYLEDFHSYRGLDHIADKETYNGLTEEGKRIAKKYVRFEIRGKLGRGVPVLVETDVLRCINLLIKYREVAGVPKKNVYLFGLPSSDNDCLRYHRACQLIRSYSTKCGAQIPAVLRGTQLRKHIATRCINLNLSENQVTDLANFMGHHEKIHKEIYRQPVLETDIIKISKILNTAQGFDESDASADENDVSVMTSRPTSSRADFSGDPGTSRSSDGSRSFNSSFGRCATGNATPRRWSLEQRKTVLSAFEQYIAKGTLPTGAEIQTLIDSKACLNGRTVPQVRSWLHVQKKRMSQG